MAVNFSFSCMYTLFYFIKKSISLKVYLCNTDQVKYKFRSRDVSKYFWRIQLQIQCIYIGKTMRVVLINICSKVEVDIIQFLVISKNHIKKSKKVNISLMNSRVHNLTVSQLVFILHTFHFFLLAVKCKS